jgi:Ca2+-binding EF-hand superfamily protein
MADTAKYEATFRVVDGDGDGYISAEEVQALMRAMGKEIDEQQAQLFVEKADGNDDGLISLQEFADLMERGID